MHWRLCYEKCPPPQLGMRLGPQQPGLHPDTLNIHWGNSLVAQWLGLSIFTARAWVQSLVGEPRFHKPHSKKKKEFTDMRMTVLKQLFMLPRVVPQWMLYQYEWAAS